MDPPSLSGPTVTGKESPYRKSSANVLPKGRASRVWGKFLPISVKLFS